jgi:hypothetical protein
MLKINVLKIIYKKSKYFRNTSHKKATISYIGWIYFKTDYIQFLVFGLGGPLEPEANVPSLSIDSEDMYVFLILR